MNRISKLGRKRTISALLTSALAVAVVQPALADSSPLLLEDSNPATVTADALPTPQIQKFGVVWAQAVVGRTVFAVGKFDTARPAGSIEGGRGSGYS